MSAKLFWSGRNPIWAAKLGWTFGISRAERILGRIGSNSAIGLSPYDIGMVNLVHWFLVLIQHRLLDVGWFS